MNEVIESNSSEKEDRQRRAILTVESQFLCCYSNVNPQIFSDFSDWDNQELLLQHTILHELNRKFAVKRSYQINFLKKWITTLEKGFIEVHDKVYEELCRLQSLPDYSEERTFKHYFLPKFRVTFSMRESKSFVSNGTTGLCTWQASLALSNWILSNQDHIWGRAVLELGAGTGLLGFVASKCCGARKMILSDGSPQVMNLLNENLNMNFGNAEKLAEEANFTLLKCDEQEIGTLMLPWEDIEGSEIEKNIIPEVILAADVVYDYSIFKLLINTLEYIFHKSANDCFLILASTIRNERTLQDFEDSLVNHGFILDRRKTCNTEGDEFWCDDSSVEIVIVKKKIS